ncbi:TadE family type IV pilus minor pilin, partial [Nonomuraea sp. SBT364]|uniref:TadE family type IV pilus minor pilin n=1 Tax=Nonomuraea sp. SBT364 TaxID=1580530 RepID=UPI002F3E2871
MTTSASKPGNRSASRGSVTAETAAVLPALMIVLAAALWAIQAAAVHLECVDAARTAARAAARGEPLDQVRALVHSAVRPSAHVAITRNPDQTTVRISVDVRPPWGPAPPPPPGWARSGFPPERGAPGLPMSSPMLSSVVVVPYGTAIVFCST